MGLMLGRQRAKKKPPAVKNMGQLALAKAA